MGLFNKGKMGQEEKSGELLNSSKAYIAMTYAMFTTYTSGDSTEKKVEDMFEIIESAGGIILGRGQNRIGFVMPDNNSIVYKVAFRQIGMVDNAREKYISNIIFNDANTSKAIGNHFAQVYDWGPSFSYYNTDFTEPLKDFIIAMERLDDLSEDSNSFDGLEDAIRKLAETDNRIAYNNMCETVSDYMYIFDLHPVKSIDNMGIKYDANGNPVLAIRDYGYFVPRIADSPFENIKDIDQQTKAVYTYKYKPITDFINTNDIERYLSEATKLPEVYGMYDKNGKLVEDSNGEFKTYESEQLYHNLAEGITDYIKSQNNASASRFNRYF